MSANGKYLAVPACLSLRSKLAACQHFSVVKVSTGCLPTRESVVCVALIATKLNCSWVGQTLKSVGKKLDTAGSFFLQLLPRWHLRAISKKGKVICCDAASSVVYALTTLTPMLLHVPATDLQIASMDMSGTSCCFC